ncbi:MAG: RND-like protein efflux transporter [Candidatus Moranbacteria bacterium GW2011_GWC2_37_73]|nr:MAG: RND-like protein efflux transporter [Parcubacteria group bacterium GW2011_GWC1_36_108]KKP99964.1 MAG: RND-like protein efflux transporter [Candidatus Moranbacteria bacterium GW2011_GWD1_36_198]KKQ39350.1 MAG: RND-like protein efflux transporter [Candidatus Moranbacteria bacterium GW2011_GWC2_37_73]HAR99916.1 hypothetical protein [Candidatus Moranbacteria bacterium]HBI51108.1 hypothetical protein [Candidatus Moranbacteria bacterium]
MKKYIISAVVIIAVFGSWQWWKNNAEKKNIPQYVTEKVVRGDVAVSFSVDGKIVYEKWELDFINSGTVDKINVKLGDIVEKGQVLASIDIEKNSSQISQAKSELGASNIDLSRLSKDGVDYEMKKRAYEDAKDKLDKEEDLYDEYVQANGKDSTQSLAQKVKVSSAEADVNNAKYQMQQVEESYKKAQYELAKSSSAYNIALAGADNSNIISPKSDVIVDAINGNVGDIVSQSSNSSSESSAGFLTLINHNNFWFESLVEDTDALKIQKDMLAYVKLDAYPDKKFEARVDFVSLIPEIDANGIPSYKVIITLTNKDDAKLLSDMAGSVELVSKEAKNVLMISNDAVKNVQGKQMVIVKKGDVFSEREIQTGFTNGKRVEIKSGLEQGEEVVITK